MNPINLIAQFIDWLQTLIEGEKVEPLPPPVFGQDTTVSQWQEGKFHTIGPLPCGVRPGHLYTLSVVQIKVVRQRTPAEHRWEQENAKSMVPTHRFELTYCPPVIKDGKADIGRPVTVFRIERNCFVPSRPGTSADWIACGEIAPKLRDRVVEICQSPEIEIIYQFKGKPLREGEKSSGQKPEAMKSYESTNKRRLELIPFGDQTQKVWEAYIDELLKNAAKKAQG